MYIENINNTNYIKVNDTATRIQLKISDNLSNPFDLKSAMQVVVVIGNRNGRILSKIPNLLDDTGVLEFGLDEGDLLEVGGNLSEVGDNLIEVHIIMPNGEKFVAPSSGHYKLRVTRSIDTLGEKITTVTLDYFLEEANRVLDEMNTKVEYVNQTAEDLRQEVSENLDSLVTQEVDNKMTPFVEVVNERLDKKAEKQDVDTALLTKRDKAVLITQNDISDELKQQMAGTTPINAVPAKGSITKDRLSQKIIGQEQTTFLQKGKNLFDKDNVLRGYFINQSGDLIENTGYSVSDFIGIKPSTNYYRNAPSTIAFYDASFSFISREYETNGLIVTPENAVYARIAMSNGYINNFQFEEGNSGTTKEDFYLTFDALKLKEQNFQNKIIPLESMKDLVIGKNKFNKLTVIKGRIDMGTGAVDGALDGYVSDFIEINGMTHVRNKVGSFAFYDENKTFIKVDLGLSDGQYHSGMLTITPPINAKFIRLGVSEGNLDQLQFEEGTISTSYEPFGYRLTGLLYAHDIEQKILPNKRPLGKTKKEIYQPGSLTHQFGDIDKYGNIWAVAWQDIIRKSTDGIKFTTVIDAKPFLDKANGETISQYALMITDTGRIVCGTSKGRVLVSDEEQTTLTEAFVFENGYTQNTWGYDKKGRYILMAAYVQSKSANSQGREVYLSKDFGATWDRIFYKDTATMVDSTNYHIHDVAFDQYSDCILVSIGDGANRNILYSYDYGETWKEMFDESIYNEDNWAPIHPTSIIIFPDGYAFGSDELPEGITWWNRPKGIEKPEIKWEDCEYKITFNEDATLIGTFAQKGDMIQTTSGIYGIMPFRNHNTQTEGHARLFATGDGGKTWHEVFKDDVWNSNRRGFWNARLREEGDGIYIYSSYSQDGLVYIWRSKMPNFIDA